MVVWFVIVDEWVAVANNPVFLYKNEAERCPNRWVSLLSQE